MTMTLDEKRQRRAAREASEKRIADARAEAQQAARGNRCPFCGRGVRRNLSLTGWVQCEQFGNPQFRKNPDEPACGWQGFTV